MVISKIYIKQDWAKAPLIHQNFYVTHTNWGLLSEDERFFSTKLTIPLDKLIGSTVSRAQFVDLLRSPYLDEIFAKVRRRIAVDGRYEPSPRIVWWLSQMSTEKLRPEERSYLERFGGAHEFDQWPAVKSKAMLEYEADTEQSQTINAYLGLKKSLSTSDMKWLAKRSFVDMSTMQKRWFISKTAWSKLTEDQQFWSMLNMFQLDTSWTRRDLADSIGHNFDDIQAHVAARWANGVNESPEQVLWISLLTPEHRTPDQEQMLIAFGGHHFDDWPLKKVWTLDEYSEEGKARYVDGILEFRGTPPDDIMAWIQKQPIAKSSDRLKGWSLASIRWAKLSDDMKFMSFQKVFNLGDRATTFKWKIENDLSGIRKHIYAQFHLLYRHAGGVFPEQLVWFNSVPKGQRTQYEKGFLNAYGYGYFDEEYSTLFRSHPHFVTWDKRTLLVKTLTYEPALKEQAKWLLDFEGEMRDIFGDAEFAHIKASMENLQGWMTSYFHYNNGMLDARQKSWGLKEMSKLQSPEGIRAFQELTVQIAMQSQSHRIE